VTAVFFDARSVCLVSSVLFFLCVSVVFCKSIYKIIRYYWTFYGLLAKLTLFFFFMWSFIVKEWLIYMFVIFGIYK